MVLSTISRLKYVCFSPSVDNFVFKLCYRWTTLLLAIFSFVVTCRLLLGDSFACISKELSNSTLFNSENYANLKCYADGIYTEPAKIFLKKSVLSNLDLSAQGLKRYQSYYSWVNLLFLVHAFDFYLPHLLWKSYENDYMLRLTTGVQDFFDKEEKRSLELCYLAKYILVTQGRHRLYSSVYIFCETCNYLISLAQTVWLIHFFDVTGIPESLPLELVTWLDFKKFYFPSTGTCQIDYMSKTKDLLCEMPLSALYMKMFLFLHFWYIILTILTGLVLVYRIALRSSSFRVFVMKNFTVLVEKSTLKSLCYRMAYSDFFFLSRLQKTMTDSDFAQLLDKITVLAQVKSERKGKTKRLTFSDEVTPDLNSSNDTYPL